MTNQITINLDGHDYEVEMFRSVEFFETFSDYMLRVMLPVFEEIPALTTLRCSLSGFPIARIDDLELADTIRHAVPTLKLTKYDSALESPPNQWVIDAIETLADHLAGRITMSARPGPAFNYKADRTSESKLDPRRQLAILLNTLLWDSGLLRDRYNGYDEMMIRYRKSFAVADQIILNWGRLDALESLYSALIELDARWPLKSLKFSQKERDRLNQLRDSESVKATELVDFAAMLLRHREGRVPESDDVSRRWTQEVYNDMAFNPYVRAAKSNIIGVTVAKKPTVTPEKKKEESSKFARFAEAFAVGFGIK